MSKRPVIWANLLHLSFNMWCDRALPELEPNYTCYKPDLRFDEPTWREILRRMAGAGFTMVVLDLGDGVRYESHPEIAVRGAWSPARLRRELDRVRHLGLEPVPKLNFSTCHDAWMGPYSRRVSTPEYYRVCADLIAEVAELFGHPRFFHLGMDEETAHHQRRFEYVVLRQHDLWWRDLLFLAAEVRKAGVRPWVWSDYVWNHREEFLARMPKGVLQSNWYYGESFSRRLDHVKAYLDLEAAGFDQVPTGSNWSTPLNFGRTVSFGRSHISGRRLKGFLQTPWKPTLPACMERHIAAIDQGAAARLRFERA